MASHPGPQLHEQPYLVHRQLHQANLSLRNWLLSPFLLGPRARAGKTPRLALSVYQKGQRHRVGLHKWAGSFLSILPLNIVVTLSLYSGYHKKIPQTEWLKQQKFIFPQFWKLGSPRSRCQQIWFLERALFLACRQLPFSLWPHMAERGVGGRKEREKELWGHLLFL